MANNEVNIQSVVSDEYMEQLLLDSIDDKIERFAQEFALNNKELNTRLNGMCKNLIFSLNLAMEALSKQLTCGSPIKISVRIQKYAILRDYYTALINENKNRDDYPTR